MVILQCPDAWSSQAVGRPCCVGSHGLELSGVAQVTPFPTLRIQPSLPDCPSQGRLIHAPQPPSRAFHACILELTCVPRTPQCWYAEPKGEGGLVCDALSHTYEQPRSGPVALPALGSVLVTLGLVG